VTEDSQTPNKRPNNNRLILAVASGWQLAMCAWLLLSAGTDDAVLPILGLYAFTGSIGLLTAALPSCPTPWAVISMSLQVLGPVLAFIYAFTVSEDPYAPLAPMILGLFVGAAILVAIIATWQRRDNAPIKIRNAPKGFCAHCKYDLKGTLDAGKFECPECGELYEPNRLASKPDWLLIALIVVLTLNMIASGTCGVLMLR
jgi:hypothetical protein